VARPPSSPPWLIIALFRPQSALGRVLDEAGISVAFARSGIVLALLFVTPPFVVRAVEPVLEELAPAEEEAAYTMGAGQLLTLVRVLLPPILPAVAAGAVQTFARSVAEFGSLAAALRTSRGRIEGPFGAAAALGANPHTLRSKMRRLGIEWGKFRGGA